MRKVLFKFGREIFGYSVRNDKGKCFYYLGKPSDNMVLGAEVLDMETAENRIKELMRSHYFAIHNTLAGCKITMKGYDY